MGNYCLTPPFFEGTFFPSNPCERLRSVGTFDTFVADKAEGNISSAGDIAVGDILLVFAFSREHTSLGPTNGGWTRIQTQSGLTNEIWTRVATGDSSDLYTAPELLDSSQSMGGFQMAALKLPYTNAPKWEESGQSFPGSGRNDFPYGSVPTTSAVNRLILVRSLKLFDGGDYPFGGSVTPDADDGNNLCLIGKTQFVKTSPTNGEMIAAWSFRFDLAGRGHTQGDYNQSPLQNGGHYGFTIRCEET